ncbi:hypothetical protein PENSPDRAFT_377224 [Peniophora sp. CONT]|nr:hypothetical protein PENSPDRAFT_377224 [Peniophora sp. CONT]
MMRVTNHSEGFPNGYTADSQGRFCTCPRSNLISTQRGQSKWRPRPSSEPVSNLALRTTMVDWQDPHTLLLQAASLQKMTCIFSGIYFYDFVLTLRYDWEIVNKLYARPVISVGNSLYILCRYLAFSYCICSCLLISSYRVINCQALLKLVTFSGVIGLACTSSLLFVRAGVIWKWNRWVVGCLVPFLGVMYALGLKSVVLISSRYDPSIGQCTLDDVVQDRAVSVATLITDWTLLAFILVGLQRSWQNARGFPLWYTLWNQGLIYFALAIAMEVPLVVFLMLNLNEVMNTFFVIPSVVMLVAGATRFHRALTRHVSRTVTVYNGVPLPATRLREPDSMELRDVEPTPTYGIRVTQVVERI